MTCTRSQLFIRIWWGLKVSMRTTLVPESAPQVARTARTGPTRSPIRVLEPPQWVSSSSNPQHGVLDVGSWANARAFQRSTRLGPKLLLDSPRSLGVLVMLVIRQQE